MKNFLTIISLFLFIGSVFTQIQINVDEPVVCPQIVQIYTGGQYEDGCPNNGYLYFSLGSYTDYQNVQYSINGGATWSNNYNFENIAPGLYNCKVRVTINGNPCVIDYPFNPVRVAFRDYLSEIWDPIEQEFILTGKRFIDTVLVTTPTVCNGLGSIEVVLIGGNSGIEFSLDGVNFQASNIFNNLPIGRYNVFLKKLGSPCIIQYRHPLIIYPKNFINSFQHNLVYFCDSYSIIMSATPSTGVEYSINNGNTWQSFGIFGNLSPGVYTLLCRKQGCVYTPEDNIVTVTYALPQIYNVQYTRANCGVSGQLRFKQVFQGLFRIGSDAFKASFDGVNYTSINPNAAVLDVPQGISRIYLKIRLFNNDECVYYFDIPMTTGILTSPTCTISNPQCLNSNGSITVGNGNSNYLYSIDGGSTWQTSHQFFNLSPGTYQTRVKTIDNLCFSENLPVTLVNENTPPGFTQVTSQNVTDCGGSNGSITITVQPGNGNPLVSIDGGITWSQNLVFNNLPSGAYTLKIKNANNSCESTYSQNPVIITEPLPPSFQNVTSTNISDCGASDGSITVTAQAGSFPTEYSKDNGVTWQSNNVFSGLAPGSYQVKIRNSNGSCIVSWPNNPVNITGPTPPTFINVSATPTSNCNVNDGGISIQATPGSSPLQFSIDGGSTWQSNGTFTNLALGNYNVRIRNNNGTCSISWPNNPVTVSSPLPPTIQQVNFTNTTDCGVNDGIINIIASQGSTSPQYSIDDGNTWQANANFGSLAPGSYHIKVRNNNGTCVVTWSGNPVVISGHTAPVISSVASTNVTDCGITNGIINIIAVPGEGAVQYSINNGASWSTNPVFNNLSAGLYHVKVKNGNGTCITEYAFNPIEISSPIAPVFTGVIFEHISDCGLQDGSIQISANAGSSTILYSINDGQSWSPNHIFSGLQPGSYSLKIKNQDNTCIVGYNQNPVILTQPIGPTFTSVNHTNATDCDSDNGSITVTAVPGSDPVSYSIDNGQTWQNTNVFNNLSQGSYFVSIRNASGTCENSYPANPVIITAPSAPSITDVNITQPSDCNQNVGMIDILYTSGSGAPQFTVNGGQTWHNNSLFTNLPLGNYQVGIRNQNGSCTYISSEIISIDPLEAPIIENVEVLGLIGCTSGLAAISIEASGQQGNAIQYSINNGASWQASSTFDGLSVGQYNILVRYSTGNCLVSYVGNPVVLNAINPPMIVNVDVQSPISCDQSNTGSIHIEASDEHNLTMNYSINNGQTWVSNPIFNQLSPGIYHVLVRNNLGCVRSYEDNPVQLMAPSQPILTAIEINNLPSCGASNGEITLQYNSTLAAEFSINNGGTWQSSPVFNGLTAGSYHLSIRNQNGECQNNYFQNPFVLQQVIDFGIQSLHVEDPTGCITNDGSIEILAQPQGLNYEYSIDQGVQWQVSNLFTSLAPNDYHIAIRRQGTSCVFHYPNPVSIQSPDAPEIVNIIISQPGCNQPTGSIEIIADQTNLQYSIDNGQTWVTTHLFDQLPVGFYAVAVRKSDGTCLVHYPNTIELTISSGVNIENVLVENNSSCTAPNGSITVIAQQPNIVYSINGGANWQAGNQFTGLPAGIYQVSIRDTVSLCRKDYPIPVVIQSSSTINVQVNQYLSTQNCDQIPAYIHLMDLGTGYEYSIDGGVTWSSQPNFNDVAPGTYFMAVRNGGCISYGDTLHFAPYIHAALDSTSSILPLDCQSNSAQLNIYAVPVDQIAQYSIDSGANWQSSNVFENLMAGIYPLMVRTVDDCTFNLGEVPIYPSAAIFIDSVHLEQPTQCDIPDAQIMIFSDNLNIEYSIDDGVSWQIEPIFTAVPEGTYYIIARVIGDTCRYLWPNHISIESKNRPTISELIIRSDEACVNGSGIIEIISASDHLNYSIDGGVTWSSIPVFTDLYDGFYTVVIKDTISACTSTSQVIEVANYLPILSGNVTGQDATSCTALNGRIAVDLDQPERFEYSRDQGANWQTEPQFVNLHPGSYLVMIKDKVNGCTSETVEIRIGWPGFDPDDLHWSTLPDVCGSSTGSISIQTQYILEYALDRSIQWQTSPVFQNLSAGLKEVRVRTDNTCLFAPGFSVMIDSSEQLEYAIDSIAPPTCSGMSDGFVRLHFPENIASKVQIIWPDGSNEDHFSSSTGNYNVSLSLGQCQDEVPFRIDTSLQENFSWEPILDTILCDFSGLEYQFLDSTLSYDWQVGKFIQHQGASITINEPSDVTLVIADDRGCQIENEWQIERTEEAREFDFLLPSEGVINIPVVAIDITYPEVNGITWNVESEHLVQSSQSGKQFFMTFDTPGIYDVECIQSSETCNIPLHKSIRIFGSIDSLTIEPSNNLINNLKNLTISPNPNNGVFRVELEYYQPVNGQIKLFSSTGELYHTQALSPTGLYEEVSIDITDRGIPGKNVLIYTSADGEVRWRYFILIN